MLCEIVGKVVYAWFPVHFELVLVCPAAKPEEAHIHGLRSVWLDCPIDYTIGSAVVSLYAGGWLGMAEFNEGVSKW